MYNHSFKSFIKNKLKEISKKNQFREITTTYRKRNNIVEREKNKLVSFSCNDYLSLSLNKKVIEAAKTATHKYGAGSGASRLITGNNPLYEKLESMLAKLKNAEACCVFGSGYLANLGVISAIMSNKDIIFIDELSHSSTYLGAKLSNAKVIKFKHNDIVNLKKLIKTYRAKFQKCLIVTEGVFSMDGDISPQDEISEITKNCDAMFLLDDAHGLGILGDGSGSNSIFKKKPSVDIYIGTLSKSLGSYGGFVCGNKTLIKFIVNRCRTQIYTTGLPPGVIGATIKALEIINKRKDLIKKPLENAKYFCKLMNFDVPSSPIVPIILGEEKKVIKISNKLLAQNFLVGAIRPPTVPEKSSRLRLAFNSSHTRIQIKKLSKVLKEAMFGKL